MPGNTFDHRQFNQDGASDLGATFAAGVLTASPSLDFVAPTGVTFTAGAALGTTPPAPTIALGSNAFRGRITFGTGSATPAGGTAFTLTLPFAITVNGAAVSAFPWLSVGNQATAAFTWAIAPTISAGTVTAYVVSTSSTITASQGATTYILNWFMVP